MSFCSHAPPCLRFTGTTTISFLHLPPGLRAHAFSSSAVHFAESHKPNLYEILGVPVSATTNEIKKRFYTLSLAHHPDKNPDDPTAHSKFTSISSAYHVLSNNARRAQYDRDHDIHHVTAGPGVGGAAAPRRGSYVGSRPASGLNKRRGPFRGPPPSFYAHGGYGNSANINNSEHQHHHQHQHQQTHPHGPSDPNSFIYHNPVPHFNATAHFRTQTHEDARRRMRRIKALEEAKAQARERGLAVDEDTSSSANRFFAVMGLVFIAMVAGSLGGMIESAPLRRSDAAAAGGGTPSGSSTLNSNSSLGSNLGSSSGSSSDSDEDTDGTKDVLQK